MTPRISVVVATLNRREMLEQCITAIRADLKGIEHEIVVVDNGSEDGTREWLRQQGDILTAQLGRPVGACRAFNVGFHLASAPFVAHLNDDDVPLDDCLAKSLAFMEAHPEVGQGAYAFDMWEPGVFRWDRVFGKIYANKGITRRELGDRAQWWTEKFWTYAGDCELSCRIMEMGYQVIPLEGCNVHDLQAQDATRRISNPRGHNEDSPKFYQYRHGITHSAGARRILHVALNVPGDRQPALERALRSLGEYRQVDWNADKQRLKAIKDICLDWDPTLVFMQFQTSGVFTREYVEALRAPGRVIVNWSGDVRNPMPRWYSDLAPSFDLTLLTNLDWVEKLRKEGHRADYLQIGFNQEIYHPWASAAESAPIVFMGNNYGHFPLSVERLEMVEFLHKHYRKQFKVYGTGWPWGTYRLNHQEEAAHYRGCKIAVGISQFELRRYTSDRLFRAMGSGPLYLTRWYPGIEEDFEQGVHLDWWKSLDELKEQVDYYLAHDDEREKIAQAGMELVHTRHTWLERVYQLQEMIGWHQWK